MVNPPKGTYEHNIESPIVVFLYHGRWSYAVLRTNCQCMSGGQCDRGEERVNMEELDVTLQ